MIFDYYSWNDMPLGDIYADIVSVDPSDAFSVDMEFDELFANWVALHRFRQIILLADKRGEINGSQRKIHNGTIDNLDRYRIVAKELEASGFAHFYNLEQQSMVPNAFTKYLDRELDYYLDQGVERENIAEIVSDKVARAEKVMTQYGVSVTESIATIYKLLHKHNLI